jgi:hypothetical protein
VAASCALLGVCLAGGPLYVSSAASESVQLQLADTCLADVAVHLPYSSDPVLLAALDRVYSSLRDVEVPIVSTSISTSFRLEDSPAISRSMVLVHRQGQERAFDPTLVELTGDDVLVPDYLLSDGAFVVGETHLELDEPATVQIGDDGTVEPLPEARSVSMSVVGSYPTIPGSWPVSIGPTPARSSSPASTSPG